MWLIINILVAVIAIALLVYAKRIDSSENYNALLIGLVGLALSACDIVSFICWAIWGKL